MKSDIYIKDNKPKKEYTALKTTQIICNGVFSLVEGQPIPDGIDKPFITSLINSKIIK